MFLLGSKGRHAALCARIVQGAQEAIIAVDAEHEVIIYNKGAERIFGYTEAEMLGRPLSRLLPDRLHLQQDTMLQDTGFGGDIIRNPEDGSQQITCLRKNGDEFIAAASIFDIGGAGDRVQALVIRDISQNRRAEEELLRLAATDPLTGAYNRREFTAIAEREARRSSRYHHPLSILMLDIDHFKRLNDTYGHAAGDKALQRFTLLCTNTLRNVDVFGRWGGEEFVALLPETDIQGAAVIAERLRKLTAENVLTVGDHKISFGVSIGVAEFKDGETGIDAALGRADSAVYDAKKAGRDRISVYRN